MWLTRLSLRRPVTLVMLLAVVGVLGAVSVFKLPLDFLPHMEMPFIGVQVPVNNGIPGQVEREIAVPIEEILGTLGGVREMFSNSDSDGCFVGVRFDWGRDVNLLRMEVKEKIDQIRPDLPADVRQVFLLTFNTSDFPIMEGRISAKGRDLSSSWDLLDQKIIGPLQRIPGVGRVNIDGVLPTQVSVYLLFDKIQEFNVDVSRLFRELEAANVELSVGEVTDGGMRYGVRTVSGIAGVEALRDLPIDERGLRLRDVADVLYGAPGLSYGRHLNGEPAVAFWIQKASGYNTVEVCQAINRELELINQDPTLQGVSSVPFFDQSEQITDSLRSLTQSGLIGSLLAVVILYLFLRHIGMTLVISVAIPLSILGTTIFLFLTGRTLNVLSMMGLMLGVGMLVDNAVVVLESIHRKQYEGYRPVAAAVRGTREVGRAITASTLTTVIVFAPIILSKGDELSVWLGEVGMTISVTLVLSLLVSLSVIPMLSVRLSRGGGEPEREDGWLRWLRSRYLRMLGWTALRHPLLTALAIIPAVLAVTVVMMKATGFGPDSNGDQGMRRDNLYVQLDFSDNVDKWRARDAVMVAEEYLESRRGDLELRDIYSYYTADRAGISLFFNDGVVSDEFYRSVRDDLREHLPVQAGLRYRFGDEEGGGSGAKTFQVTIHGEDTEYLYDKADDIKALLTGIEGVSDLRSDTEGGTREIRVNVDQEAASRFGITASTISQIMGLTYRGVLLPRLNTGTKEVDMVVSLDPADRESIENLSILTVGDVDGGPVQLAQVADFTVEPTPQAIRRADRRSGVTIRGAYDGEKLDDCLAAVRHRMDQVEFPLGYGWSFGSEIRRNQEQKSEMGLNMLLALACVFFVMASLFESLLHPLVVMACVPFASVGVFWIMMATGTPFNMMAMIGMVILIGIVVNNGIVLVDHLNHHRRHGLSVEDALLRACGERLRPILMTAGTTILGLTPLALAGGAHVGDAEYFPMARAIIGGLASSTLLTLIVLPTYYLLADRYVNGFKAVLGRMRRGGVAAPTALRPAPAAADGSPPPPAHP
ncbi:efflux RND transporter permease subunit [bacterium]|nr:efflux RND transporter permease subunit [bacterium]